MISLVSSIIAFITNSILVWLVAKKGLKNATHLTFFLLLLSYIIYIVPNYIAVITESNYIALWTIRIDMSIAIFQTVLFYIFAKTFPNTKLTFSKPALWMLLSYSMAVALFCYTPWLFSDVELINGSAKLYPEFGVFIFGITTATFIILGIYHLVKKYKTASGIPKTQLLYIIIGTATMYGLLFCLAFVFSVITNTDFFPSIAPIFFLTFTILTTYAITRHRLFDIRVVIQSKYIRTIITVLAFVFVFAVAYIVMWLTNNVWLFMLVALVGTLFVQFGLNRVFQRYLNQSVYDLSLPPELKLLDNTQTAVNKVFELVQQHLHTEFGARGSVAFIYDWLDKRYRSLNTEKPLLISEQHALVRVMNTSTDVITLVQLKQADTAIAPADKDERDELLRFFHKHGYVMILPLYNPVMVYGFVAVTDMEEAGSNENKLALSDSATREKLLNLGQKYGYYLGQVLTYEALVRQGREDRGKEK